MAIDIEVDDYYAQPHLSAGPTSSCAQYQQLIRHAPPPCIIRDPFLFLRNFDMLGPHQPQVMDRAGHDAITHNAHHESLQLFNTALEHEESRQKTTLACVMNACLPRPAFDEHCAYINDSRCAMQCSTVYVARADGSDSDLPEPWKPSDAASVL